MMRDPAVPASMYFRGLGTATPPARYTKEECINAFQIDPNTLSQRFLVHAPLLAITAGQRALAHSGLQAVDIDAVVVSTSTG